VPVPIPNEIKRQIDKLLAELNKRSTRNLLNELYLDGCPPFPQAIIKAKVTKAYRNLMPVSSAPWASLVVDSTLDRLEVSGVNSEDKHIDDLVWNIWQSNQMDSESKLGLGSTLVNGRSFATVWRPPGSKEPQISLDDSSTMIVQYAEGDRRQRVAALRRWKDEDDGKNYVTLYRPDGIFKFVEAGEGEGRRAGRAKAGGIWWEAREEDSEEEWPLENPWGVVPVVELAINRRLKPGCFPYARGEYEHCLGLIDRINLLTFLGLVVAFWMGFPLRGVIGERILKDDDNEPLPPFDSHASGAVQFEDPAAKTFEYPAADRKLLSILPELDQLSTITKTPRHYFPMENGMTNLAADAIRASEGSLHAKVTNFKASSGDGFEEILRLCGLMSDEEVELSPRAALDWIDHETRSIAEAADAATKLSSIGLPWQVIGGRYLNFTQEDIAQIEAMMASSSLTKLISEAQAPVPTTPPEGDGPAPPPTASEPVAV
jgi:hypothetical protein